MNLSKIISLSVLVGFIGIALVSNFALGAEIPGIDVVGPTSVTGIVDVIRNVIKWIYIIFFIIAVLFILMAAFTYLSAGGDAEKVNTAKNKLIYAAVAIAVALLAIGFETIIRTFLSSGA